jgi:hypothetical protein
VRQRTWERYEQIVRVHIKPTLGRAKLKTLNPAQVRALYRERLEGGSSPRTVQYVHVTLHNQRGQPQPTLPTRLSTGRTAGRATHRRHRGPEDQRVAATEAAHAGEGQQERSTQD